MDDLVSVLLLAGLVWWLWRQSLPAHPPRERSHLAPESPRVTEILPCAHCGTYVPADRAISRHGRTYCGEDHAQAAHRRD